MAEPHRKRLQQIVDSILPLATIDAKLECKHYFSGAALYANETIMASLGPVGFGIKLPETNRRALMENGSGAEFRFFPEGPVKREYVLLSESIIEDRASLRQLIERSVSFVLGE